MRVLRFQSRTNPLNVQRFVWSRYAQVFVLASVLFNIGCGSSSSSSPTPTASVQGRVSGGSPVVGATVSFIEAFAAGDVSSLQPLEDLAASAPQQTITDGDGNYSIEVDEGRYFIYVIPASHDGVHLPGGDRCRSSISLEGETTSTINLTVSERPPDDATYIGSSSCLGCHPGHADSRQTLHFLGFRRLTAEGSEPSSLQDLSKFPDADQGLAYFPDGNPEDNTGPEDGFGFRIATAGLDSILLGVDETGFFQAIESGDESLVSEPLYIEFTYGGEGRFRQQYVTRLDKDGFYTPDPTLGTYQVLPGQFSETAGEPVPPPPADETETDCHFCHETRVPDRHHVLYEQPIPPGSVVPYPDTDGDGSLDPIYVCLSCHEDGDFSVVRDCITCHGTSPHEDTSEGVALEVTMPGWTTYHLERWAAPLEDGSKVGASPTHTESFDNTCSGCHFTGMGLTRNGDGLFQAHAVPDPGGPFDFDGDGQPDEMNVGCERCHGPGSEHAARPPGSIVQPDHLPPGRGNLVCGQCHMDGQGNGTIGGEGEGEYPSRNDPAASGAIDFVEPGLTPAEFFGTSDGSGILPNFGTTGGFFDPVDLRVEPNSWSDRTGGFGSRLDHARANRWHYQDHTRSSHARNPFEMATCWDCHDSHRVETRGQTSSTSDNNVLCFRCHAGHGDFGEVTQEMVDVIDAGWQSLPPVNEATHEHIKQKTFDLVFVSMNLAPSVYTNPGGRDALGRCTVCHMPRTARSGSRVEDDEGFVVRGDITSHSFDNISPDTSEAMADAGLDPVINSCVECHRGIPRGAWPDYRFKK